MTENKTYKDKYADIGTQEVKSLREELVVEEVQPLPEIYLKADEVDPKAVFTCENKEWSMEKLEEAIAEQKAHYMPFFADFAPKLSNYRTCQELKTFDWRVGTEEDARNFLDVLKGKGSWEEVTIPHFGPPLGKATTYYRTEFTLSEEELAKDSKWICFKAVDYKAQVYINEVFVGEHTGIFAPFEFEITKQAKLGKNSCLVVVENDFIPMGSNAEYRGEDFTGDKIYAATGLGYDEPLKGWHHCPPGMGIWQEVYVECRCDLFIHDIFVRPVSRDKAEVWVEIYGTKVGKRMVTLDVSLYGQNFEETVFEHMPQVPDMGYYDERQQGTKLLMEHGMNYVKFDIDIPDAKIWDTTKPWLYQIQLGLKDESGCILDTGKRQFGMRFFTMDEESDPKGTFYLNGRRIKFRGVNSQGREQRMVFLKRYDELLRDYLLAKVGNINYLRITQRPVQPEVYDMCDKLGLLVQTDFPAFGSMRRNTLTEAIKQAQEMEHLIRSHPSCILCTYINEPFPFAQSKPHRCVERHEMEAFFACADRMIHILNPDRVIKPIDGDYDPPVTYGLPDYHCYTCWYNGHGVDLGKLHKGYWLAVKEGWNYGCGEYGMEGLDPIPLMRKYWPKEWLAEQDEDDWNPANVPGDPPPQVGFMHYSFFETPRNMKEWVEASQTYQAKAMNFMTRAYRRNPKMVSYAYHVLIDAYPDGWMKAMVDYEGTPKKAFWEYKEASAPVMVDLRTDKFKVWGGKTAMIEARICNDLDEELHGYKLKYQAILQDKLLFAEEKTIDIPAFDITFEGFIPVKVPAIEGRTELFVQIVLESAEGNIVSSYELKLEAFPENKKTLKKLAAIGMLEEFSEKVAKEYIVDFIPLENAGKNTAILVFDLEAYKEKEAQCLDLVQKGATIIFFNLPLGNTLIAKDAVEVNKCPKRKVHFAARNMEHPMVADFKKDDINYWFDESEDCISPVLGEMFEAEGYQQIVTTVKRVEDPNGNVQGSCSGIWSKSLAVGEKPYGKGMIRVSQIDFSQRIVENPTANILFERLIDL